MIPSSTFTAESFKLMSSAFPNAGGEHEHEDRLVATLPCLALRVGIEQLQFLVRGERLQLAFLQLRQLQVLHNVYRQEPFAKQPGREAAYSAKEAVQVCRRRRRPRRSLEGM